ncbi:MAG TPA: PRD domain-containing protein [Actinotalea sp.]
MRIKKVFNNSVVLGVDDRGTELVLLGRGLGFQASPGDRIDESLIEKTFVPGGTTTAERLAAFVDEIPLEDIDVCEEIVRAAKVALGPHVTDHVLVPLADHVSFALRRAREGAGEIEYPLRWEVQYLYPAEVAFSREALRIIEARRGIRLPDLEAVPLALHFVNAQFGSSDLSATMRMTEVLTETLAIIRAEYGVDIDEDSVPVARFVTHLRYLFLRQAQGRQFVETGSDLHDVVRAAKPREWACAGRISTLLAERFGWAVTTEELLYLALHVTRLTAQAASPSTGTELR